MSEQKVESKYIDKDPPMGTEQQLEKKNNDYLAYLKEKLNFILGTYGRRLTSANGEINELVRTAEETTSRLSDAEGDISAISQRADNIEIAVAGKVGENEVIAKINASPEQITIDANRISITGFVTFSDLSTAGNTTINGANVTTGLIKDAANKNSWDLQTGTFVITNGSLHITTSNEESDIIQLNAGAFTAEITPRWVETRRVTSANSFFARLDGIFGVVNGGKIVNGDYKTVYSLNAATGAISAGGYGWDGSIRLVKAAYDGTYSSNDMHLELTANGDVVVEKGTTTDGWAYRKWYSGVYECWKEFTVSIAVNSAWQQFCYGEFPTQSYPVTFDSAPYEIASLAGSYGWAVLGCGTAKQTTTKTSQYYLFRPAGATASAVNYNIEIYARGTVS